MNKENITNRKNKMDDPEYGLSTESLCSLSKTEKDDFRTAILNHSNNRTKEQKIRSQLFAIKLEMEEYLADSHARNLLVGDFLKSLLKAASIKQKNLANYIGLQPSNLSKILKGDRPISKEMAVTLNDIFGIEPETWLHIQTKNDIRSVMRLSSNGKRRYSLKDLLGG